MDSPSIVLHYPDMEAVPIYALYGELEDDRQHAWLHWETIQSRSRLHGYRIAPHRHEHFFQILHMTGGRAAVTLDGVASDVSAPAIVAVPSITVHGYAFSRNVDGVVVTLMERDLNDVGVALPEAVVIRRDVEPVASALRQLVHESDHPGVAHDAAMRALLALLLIAFGRAPGSTHETRSAAGPALRHAQTFRRLVDRKFRQTRRLTEYAAEIGISETHLSRICRSVLGASPLQVIERRTAIEARRQLMFSDRSIKEIAAGLGYEDPAYFTRFVRRVLGAAPTAIRATARGV